MINRINKYEGSAIILIALIQIILLLIALPANTYTISQSISPTASGSVATDNKMNSKLLSVLGSALSWLFTIKQIGLAAAATVGCCTNTCTPASSAASCSSTNDYAPTSCSSLSATCGPAGTCIDTNSGTCIPNIKQGSCQRSGEHWTSSNVYDAQVNGNYLCRSSCCDFGGTDQKWIPSVQCTAEGGSVTSIPQASCGTGGNYGACVKTSGGCTMTLSADCPSNTQEHFRNGLLCTDPSLHTGCAPTSNTICKGTDVYFVDNCSNVANPYNSAKIINNLQDLSNPNWAYWNYTIKDSSQVGCSPGQPGCGLCNYPSSSICRKFNPVTDSQSLNLPTGDYFCSPLTCDVTNNPYFPSSIKNAMVAQSGKAIANNGESWCVYQGHVGGASFSLGSYSTSTDPIGSYSGTQSYSTSAVGSYSAVQICNNGVIKNDTGIGSQNEYRMFICGESIDNHSSSNPTDWTVQAENRQNNGLSCFNVSMKHYVLDKNNNATVVSSEEAATHNFNLQACTNYSAEDATGHTGKGGPDCRLQTVNLTQYNTKLTNHYKSNFIFDICVPKYPIGFNINPASDPSTAPSNVQATKAVCGVANLSCVTVWQKGLLTKTRWCVENCQCLTQNFANQMNDLCVSAGDCGDYVNVAGQYTKNIKTFSIGSLPGNYATWDHHINGQNYNVTGNGDINSSLITYYKNLLDVSLNPNNITSFYKGNHVSYGGNVPWYITPQGLAAYGLSEASYSKGYDVNNQWLGQVGQLFGGSGWAFIGGGAVFVAGTTAATLILTGVFTMSIPVIGWIFGGLITLAGLVAALLSLLGKNYEVREISFVCKPWSPPSTSNDCHLCGSFGLPCTQYQCESLGACEINSTTVYGSQTPVCSKIDTSPPIVKFDTMSGLGVGVTNQTIQNQQNQVTGTRLIKSGNGCFQGGSLLNFSLKTFNSKDTNTEFSYCGWTYNASAAEGVSPDGFNLGSSNKLKTFPTQDVYRSYLWNFTSDLPLITSPFISSSEVYDDGKKANVSISIVCESITNQRSVVPIYTMSLCINSNPDPNPAYISSFNPPSGSYLASGNTNLSMTFSINKAANCSWTNDSSKTYSQMTHKLNDKGTGNYCIPTYGSDPTLGETCFANITGLNSSKSANNIYFSCNTTSGVTNIPPIPYVLKGSQGPLNITALYATTSGKGSTALDINGKTNTTITTGGTAGCFPGTGPGTNSPCYQVMYLNATTSGGARGDGNSVCSYSFNHPKISSGVVTFSSDLTSSGSRHDALVNLDDTQYYNVTVTCQDTVGNKATKYALFKFNIDQTPPVITRISKSGETATLTTNENALCYYSTAGCTFNINSVNATSMDSQNAGLFGLTHSISMQKGTSYYVKCKDIWNNINSGCAAIVSSV